MLTARTHHADPDEPPSSTHAHSFERLHRSSLHSTGQPSTTTAQRLAERWEDEESEASEESEEEGEQGAGQRRQLSPLLTSDDEEATVESSSRHTPHMLDHHRPTVLAAPSSSSDDEQDPVLPRESDAQSPVCVCGLVGVCVLAREAD